MSARSRAARRDTGGESATAGAAAFLPARRSLAALRKAAQDCRGCALHARATQAVFGEGRRGARIMLVGEQPGDDEDHEGRPFVGPAGRVLDAALRAAGIDRADCYVSNTVKHFKWQPRGKRRMHSKPNAAEQRACRPWLDAELEQIRPELLVCLGATAAQALLGRGVRVTVDHGRALPSALAKHAIATIHPSSVLRQPDADARERARRQLTDDLRAAAALLRG
ncbi:UdgX family uracil-DNA binding protein [Solimonas soli]|uniref:UdgX family uracil-DNA binding protein n=1 Tax=Solimonas soli TaxID=413479 RepID=UPI0004B4F08C|nr:UdgX family uracil-DNA binding protein [Solimonas soli]